MREYDIIAIGGGSGGIATMNRAGEHGAKAAVIEEKKLGGTCVNVGCVPKKIMWYGAQITETFHQFGEDYGFKTTDLNFDFATLRRNREAYIDRARSSYDGSFKRNGVDLIEGHAEFVDSHTVSVNGELIRAKHIVIAQSRVNAQRRFQTTQMRLHILFAVGIDVVVHQIARQQD